MSFMSKDVLVILNKLEMLTGILLLLIKIDVIKDIINPEIVIKKDNL